MLIPQITVKQVLDNLDKDNQFDWSYKGVNVAIDVFDHETVAIYVSDYQDFNCWDKLHDGKGAIYKAVKHINNILKLCRYEK